MEFDDRPWKIPFYKQIFLFSTLSLTCFNFFRWFMYIRIHIHVKWKYRRPKLARHFYSHTLSYSHPNFNQNALTKNQFRFFLFHKVLYFLTLLTFAKNFISIDLKWTGLECVELDFYAFVTPFLLFVLFCNCNLKLPNNTQFNVLVVVVISSFFLLPRLFLFWINSCFIFCLRFNCLLSHKTYYKRNHCASLSKIINLLFLFALSLSLSFKYFIKRNCLLKCKMSVW